jgi:hypothetical protein
VYIEFTAQLSTFITYSTVLILKLDMVDRWKYLIDYFARLFALLRFAGSNDVSTDTLLLIRNFV